MDFKQFLQIQSEGIKVYILDPPYFYTENLGYKGDLTMKD